jgi:hypothetical protein
LLVIDLSAVTFLDSTALNAVIAVHRRQRLLDGDLVQAPLNQGRMPVDVIGVPVPVLDEQTEMFWWNADNHVRPACP